MKRIGILLEFNYEDLEVRPLYVRALSPTRELAEQLRKEIRYNRLMSSVKYDRFSMCKATFMQLLQF